MKIKSMFITFSLILVICFGAFNVSAAGELTSGNFTYVVEGGNVTIISCDVAALGEVAVPSTIESYSVTKIDMYAFEDCIKITSIVIPDSVISIGENAFSGCTSLKTATIGNSVTQIPAWAFYGCVSLESVTIGSGVSDVDAAAFEKCAKLSTISVSNSNNNFKADDGVLLNKAGTEIAIYPQGKETASYTVPNTVTTIKDTSFTDAVKLTEVTIPASVTSIAVNAFSSCDNLASITVNTSNANYSSEGGVLFNKNKTELKAYPKKKSATAYTVPNSVTTISAYAFSDCDVLTSVTMPGTVVTIGEYAFYSCSNLAKINIPYSVTSLGNSALSLCLAMTDITIPDSLLAIDKYVFFGCSNLKEITLFKNMGSVGASAFSFCGGLTDVYYTGTESGWGSIEIASGNENLADATIHYTHSIVKEIVITNNGTTINATVRAENIPSNAVVYLAAYNSDGDMLKAASLSSSNLSAQFSSTNVESIKLFVWQTNMQPIFDAIEKGI